MLGAARFCEIDKHWMKNQEVESREWTREYIKEHHIHSEPTIVYTCLRYKKKKKKKEKFYFLQEKIYGYEKKNWKKNIKKKTKKKSMNEIYLILKKSRAFFTLIAYFDIWNDKKIYKTKKKT